MQVLVRDESATGAVTNELTLDLLDETISVRELIRSRVYQEVDDYNRRLHAAGGHAFNGLVTPGVEERQLNQHARHAEKRAIDWQKQFAAACAAFERNGFFILVDDRQAETLDEQITLRARSAVSFVKLTPLVGG